MRVGDIKRLNQVQTWPAVRRFIDLVHFHTTPVRDDNQ